MGKDKNSLNKSQGTRFGVLTKYGFIPESIMLHDKSDKAIDLITDERSYANSFWKPRNEEEAELIASGRAIQLSSAGVRAGALSRFPQNIGRYLVKMYSDEGDTVIDPFAGHNSRMELVYRCNRSYIGFDICHEFMEANRKIKDMLLKESQGKMLAPESTMALYEIDSRLIGTVAAPSCADMCLTSPPFWDVEYYGDESGQLGNCQMYSSFLDELGKIISNCYEALKPGKYICWEVQDFRKDGRYYALHSDVCNLYKQIGFKLHDIIIVDFGTSISAAFASQLEEQKRTAKRHSYVVIGKKTAFL